MLRICDALHITPDEILTREEAVLYERQEELFERLNNCSEKEKETAYKLLDTYLRSLT